MEKETEGNELIKVILKQNLIPCQLRGIIAEEGEVRMPAARIGRVGRKQIKRAGQHSYACMSMQGKELSDNLYGFVRIC